MHNDTGDSFRYTHLGNPETICITNEHILGLSAYMLRLGMDGEALAILFRFPNRMMRGRHHPRLG